MTLNFETKLKVFFILIIAGIIGIAAFTYQYFLSASGLNSNLKNSNQLHAVSQALLIDIQDLELNARGYSLTADSNYLPQYRQARNSTYSHLNQLNSLTRQNSEFQRRLRTLSILINQKTAYADRLIHITDEEGVTAAANFFKTGTNSDLMQQLRFTLKTINFEEEHLLKQRNRDYELQLLDLRYTYFALLIALLVAVGTIGYFTIYQTRLRKARKKRLVEREQQLDQKVQESLQEIQKQYQVVREIAMIQSHQVRAPIATILGLIHLFDLKNPADPHNADILLKLKAASEAFDEVIAQVVKMTEEIGKPK